MEVDLERDRGKALQQRTSQGFTDLRGEWNELYAVAVAVRAELAFEQYDSRAVVQFLVRTIEDVRMAGARSLGIYVSALLAHYLVKCGRVEEAGEVWVDHALPCDSSELLDLNGQSWRRMEALSCARVMLLAEQDDLGGARELVDALCSTASERGMTRTALRGLGLSIAVAHRAGDEEQALSRLVEFLRLTREVDYVRPLVSQGKTSRTLLRRLLATNLDADLHQAAESTLARLGEPSTVSSEFIRESWTYWPKSAAAAGTRRSRSRWASPTEACATTSRTSTARPVSPVGSAPSATRRTRECCCKQRRRVVRPATHLPPSGRVL